MEGHDMYLTPGCLGIVMPLSHVSGLSTGHRGVAMGFSSPVIHFKTTTSLLQLLTTPYRNGVYCSEIPHFTFWQSSSPYKERQ
jgi:hypothetical protein